MLQFLKVKNANINIVSAVDAVDAVDAALFEVAFFIMHLTH